MKVTDCDWRKLFGVPLYALANRRGLDRFILAIRALASVVLRRPNRPMPLPGAVLFVNSTVRTDYQQIIGCSFAACRQPKILWSITYGFGLNARGLGLLVSHVRDFAELRRVIGADFVGSLVLFAAWVKCIQLAEIADRLDYRVLVVAADMQVPESFLVQHANRMGITTVTCQHGLYSDDGGLNSFTNINMINYLNCTARYFLAWGKRTKALMEKYTSTKCIVVGNPAIPNVVRRENGRYFYVLTDSDLRFRKYNERLLAIASEASRRLNLPFFVRFHPDNNPSSYGCYNVANDQHPLHNAAFAIAHLTSHIYVAMQSGVPVYRLISNEPNHEIGRQFQFVDRDDLVGKTIPSAAFIELGKTFIEYVGDDSAARYADLFDRLIDQPTCEHIHSDPAAAPSVPEPCRTRQPPDTLAHRGRGTVR